MSFVFGLAPCCMSRGAVPASSPKGCPDIGPERHAQSSAPQEGGIVYKTLQLAMRWELKEEVRTGKKHRSGIRSPTEGSGFRQLCSKMSGFGPGLLRRRVPLGCSKWSYDWPHAWIERGEDGLPVSDEEMRPGRKRSPRVILEPGTSCNSIPAGLLWMYSRCLQLSSILLSKRVYTRVRRFLNLTPITFSSLPFYPARS